MEACAIRVLRMESVSTLCGVYLVETLPELDKLLVKLLGVDWDWV